MKNFKLLLTVVFCLTSNPILAQELVNDSATTVYLIRHTEKDLSEKDDPQLTEQGIQRAKNWARFFSRVELDAVFSTDTARTRDTAQVVAESQAKTVVLYDVKTIDADIFHKENLGKTVLMVGHSNTIPAFTNALIGQQKYNDLDESDYDTVFVVDLISKVKQAKSLVVEHTMPSTKLTEE